ncbi:MAG TPA: protein kinase, partial [Polyangiaceae bacterium]|nr:protein kinase [Polyangiaceae bacterium]
HRMLERPFALKVLRSDLSRDHDLGERFLREAKAAASVSHPNIVQITDFGTLPSEQPYFVMELLTGESLSSIIRKGGPLPAARAVRLLVEMISALDAAHTAGVVHRDLKPDNVLVCPTLAGETTKILDFGLAKVAGQSRLTKAGVVFGTPHYMSPEQASGGIVDERTDLYALGVVMYEMFTGRVPFEADTYMGVLTKHLYVAPTPPSVILGGIAELGALEMVVLRCLEKKPERRFASMQELGVELARIAKFREDGGFTLEPAQPGERRVPRLADELELPTDTELRASLSRSGIPGRRLPPSLVAALLSVGALCAVAVSWGVLRARSASEPPTVTPVPAAVEVAPAHPASGPPPAEPALRPDVPLEVTPAASPSTTASPPRADRSHPVGKSPPHLTKKDKPLPPSGLSNDPIAKGKVQENGIVDPWTR